MKCYVSRPYVWTVRWGNGYNTTLPLEVFTQRNSVAELIRVKLNFIFKKYRKKLLFEQPFGKLGVTYALHLLLIGKPVVDFLPSELNFFCYRLHLRCYKRKSEEVGIFQRGVRHLRVQIRDGRERRLPTAVGVKKLD